MFSYTGIPFVGVCAKFGTCTVVSLNGTLVEAKMSTFTIESTHFNFNKCPIYTYDGTIQFNSDFLFDFLYWIQTGLDRHILGHFLIGLSVI